MGVFDWVLSLEVLEHIPPQFEKDVVDNVVRAAREGIVLSWAIPGQGGFGHFNEQPNDAVIAKLEARCFDLDIPLSNSIRESAYLWYFKNTVLAFRRRPQCVYVE